MSKFGILLRWAVAFILLVIGTSHVSSAELGKLETFYPERITDFSLSPQQHLWFLSKNRFVETELVEGQWASRRFIVTEDSHLESKDIYDFAVTEHHLWTIERDKISVSELSETQPYLKNTKELILSKETSEHIDMVAALDGSGVVVNVTSGIYVLNLDDAQISVQELNPDFCVGPKNLQMTAQWLVVECDNSNTVIYQKTGQGYEFLHSIGTHFLFLNPEEASFTVYQSGQYKISTLSLATLTEISSVSGILDVYQHSNNSLLLVEKTDPVTSGRVRELMRLNADGSLKEELKLTTQSFNVGLVNYADFSSFLYEAGDKIFRGFDYWLKDPETGLYGFRGNDWQYKLGLSGLESFPASNAFISGAGGKQIWYAAPSEIPKLQGYALLKDQNYQPVGIQETVNHQQKWWFVSSDYSTTYVGLWTKEQEFKQIDVPIAAGLGVDSATYIESTDSIIIYTREQSFIECQNASDLQSATQCRSLGSPERIKSTVLAKSGVLIFHYTELVTELDAVMYDVTTSGLQERWRLRLDGDYASSPALLYVPEYDIVLGRKGHLVLAGPQYGTLVKTPDSSFISDGCAVVGSRDVLCSFGVFRLFRYNQDFSLGLEITPALESSPFRQGIVGHTDLNGNVLVFKDRDYFWHSLDLPPISFTDKKFVTEAFQDQDITVNLKEHLTALDSLSISYGEVSNPSTGTALLADTRLNDYSWKLNTKNEIALFNSMFSMNFHFSNSLWNMHLNYGFALHNVNDAPEVAAGQFVNDLEIGEAYVLNFMDVFSDIDRDRLSYKTTTLPAGFVLTEGLILVNPTSAGRYQFTVTATDPSGASVAATFSGSVIAKAETGSEEQSSGGSTTIWSLILLMALSVGRSNRMRTLQKR